MEPDIKYGRGYIDALARAINDVKKKIIIMIPKLYTIVGSVMTRYQMT